MALHRDVVVTWLSLAAFTVTGSSCNGGTSKPIGSEGGPCTSGGACDQGLTCLSDLCVDATPGTSTKTGTGKIPSNSTDDGGYAQVTTGMRHSCALRNDHTAVCWGYNGCGQTNAPSGTYKQISAGILHTCGLRSDGSITCWGGFSDCARKPAPSADYSKIVAGNDSTCGLTSQGTVVCWGCSDSVVPTNLGAAIDVGAGAGYFCALTTERALVCWGKYVPSSLPTVAGADVLSLFSQSGYGCIHAADGSFTCWEEITTFNPDDSMSTAAEPVDSPPGPFTQVRAGHGHFCGLRADKTVECWGFNPDGRATAPTGTFLDVAPGGFHTCGLRTDHSIACWGSQTDGGSAPPSR